MEAIDTRPTPSPALLKVLEGAVDLHTLSLIHI